MWATGTAADYLDLLDKLNDFLTLKGSAFGLSYVGTGNGTFTAYSGGASSVAETFTITATSATNWTVVGSISGSIGPATTGTPFSHAKLVFTITAGGTAFVAGDVFLISTAPKWTNLRKAKGCTVTASQFNSGTTAAQNVVDGKLAYNQSNSWLIASGALASEWLQFDFVEPETFTQWAMMGGTFTPVCDLLLEYWDGAAWQQIDLRLAQDLSQGEIRVFSGGAFPAARTRYRLTQTQTSTPVNRGLAQMYLRRSDNGYNAAVAQYAWKAPGNDGDSEIFVGVHPLLRQDADYYNWEIAAFDGWNAAVDFHAQVGYHGRDYLPLWNQALPYWFVCNGRCAKVIVKIGTQYEMAYLGFYDPYLSPNQLPYPIAIGATVALGDPFKDPGLGVDFYWDDARLRYSNSGNTHRMPTHSDDQGSGGSQTAMKYQMRLRQLDGVWVGLMATRTDNFASPPSTNQGFIWPYDGDLNNLDVNRDGSYTRWPVVLLLEGPNVVGQLDGVSAVTGQAVTAETILTEGPIGHLVLPNIFRTDRNDFLAVALD